MGGSGQRGPVEMPVSLCELSVVFVVWCCCTSVSAVSNKPKSVVFSYAASHPHVATLSHHYRAPPSPRPDYHQPLPAQDFPDRPPSDINHYQHQSSEQSGQGGVINFDHQPADQPHINEYTTVNPEYGPSTMVYDNHRPADYNYQSYSPPESPYHDNNSSGHSSGPPGPEYQSNPIFYNDRPPDESLNIQPQTHQGYPEPSTVGYNPPEIDVPVHRYSQKSQEAGLNRHSQHSNEGPRTTGLNPETYNSAPDHRHSQQSQEAGLNHYPGTYNSAQNHHHSQQSQEAGLNHYPETYNSAPNHHHSQQSQEAGLNHYPETYNSAPNHHHSHQSQEAGLNHSPEMHKNVPNYHQYQPSHKAGHSQYPETYDSAHNHRHSYPSNQGPPTTANHSPETYDSVPYRDPQPSNGEVHYTTPYPNNVYDYTIYHSTPTKSSVTEPVRLNGTHPNINPYSPDNFPDYQAPASPEFFDHSSYRPRGGKTFSPSPSSTTPVYYDENEYISTTPILEFESVKENLPSIKDYPPPNPGYITETFKNTNKRRKTVEKLTRRPSKALDKSSLVHHDDKVLQKPRFFAYSSDLLDEHGDIGGQEVEQSEENEEYDHVDHEDKKKKDEEHVKGGGQEHHSAHKTTAGDKGDKGYKSGHKHEEEKKGHHNKEDHKGKYLDEKGKKGKKEEEGGHYGENHKEEKGKKAAKYGESGEHKKGHSTKGEHNIHKVDEYMKKHEFYDEHHEGGDHEKFGGFMEAHAHKKGGKRKKGHHKGGHHHKRKGKKGHHEKGNKLGHHKGHKDAKGYDGHFSKGMKYGKKGGSKKYKNWGYSKGSPPK